MGWLPGRGPNALRGVGLIRESPPRFSVGLGQNHGLDLRKLGPLTSASTTCFCCNTNHTRADLEDRCCEVRFSKTAFLFRPLRPGPSLRPDRWELHNHVSQISHFKAVRLERLGLHRIRERRASGPSPPVLCIVCPGAVPAHCTTPGHLYDTWAHMDTVWHLGTLGHLGTRVPECRARV